MRSGYGALVLATLLITGCASVPPHSASPAAEAEIVAAANGLFAAMLSRDTVALRAMLHPELRITSLRSGAGEPQLRVATVDDFVASIGRGGEPLYERMWDPRVEVSGDFASLWAPYDFHIGDRFSHCGHDAFDFARIGGRWVIVGLAYTVQPAGCPPAPPR